MKQRTVELSNAEKKKLSQALLGYGKLVEASEKTGLHINTLRYINLTGSGKPESIAAIRENLIGTASLETINQ